MKEYKVIKYTVSDPFYRRNFHYDMEKSLNSYAKAGWKVLSIAGADYCFTAILERDISCDISRDISESEIDTPPTE